MKAGDAHIEMWPYWRTMLVFQYSINIFSNIMRFYVILLAKYYLRALMGLIWNHVGIFHVFVSFSVASCSHHI